MLLKEHEKKQVSNQIAANGGCSLKGHGSGCTGHLANWSDLAPEDDELLLQQGGSRADLLTGGTGSARRSRGNEEWRGELLLPRQGVWPCEKM